MRQEQSIMHPIVAEEDIDFEAMLRLDTMAVKVKENKLDEDDDIDINAMLRLDTIAPAVQGQKQENIEVDDDEFYKMLQEAD